ncbi:MAG: modulated sigma54 specific transcriptional regulator, Fis family [Anaerosporomusa subterranea]|nr:modulated sigma54 specific transcriptional regulator, Fis family [Anaerosporomusa subterranea]
MEKKTHNAPKLDDLFSSEQEIQSWFLGILDSIYDGILVADKQNVVRYVNPEYTRITGVQYHEIIGKYLADVRPGAMLPQIIQSGIAMDGVYRREGDVEYVVDMAPIKINGLIVGGISVVKDITEVRRLTKEVSKYEKKTNRLKHMVQQAYRAKYTFGDLIGDSEESLKVAQFAKKIALGDTDILITGESGTGKELYAQAIHNASRRAAMPFVALNCATLTPSLVESELFGYEEGAFTGARKGGKTGLFEIADAGTILLDEIGELSLKVQAKLLRVLQERTVRKVGESTEISVDVRIIASTNRDLRTMVTQERFREDLFYRLNVLNVKLPPLRERILDVVPLAKHFLAQYARRTGKIYEFSLEVFDCLVAYHWPGNIRELKNTVEFAANMCEELIITPIHLPTPFYVETFGPIQKSLSELVGDAEKKIIQSVLRSTGVTVEGKRRAAAQLRISLATLYNKIKLFSLDK